MAPQQVMSQLLLSEFPVTVLRPARSMSLGLAKQPEPCNVLPGSGAAERLLGDGSTLDAALPDTDCAHTTSREQDL